MPEERNVPTFINPEDHTIVAQPSAMRTVLYVEDHPVNVLLMQSMFAMRPHLRLLVANTLEAGLLAAIEARPELLLLDLNLPDGNGIDLLRRMRGIDHLSTVTAVAVTADGLSDLVDEGFREVWHKPMDIRTALHRLDRLLAQPERSREPSADVHATVANDWTHGPRGRRPPPDPIPFPTPAQRHGEAPRGHSDTAALAQHSVAD